jgi:transaldolase
MSDPAHAPLYKMVQSTPTDYWNDSCSVEELTYAIERGAIGATTNPTIVLNVLKKEMHLWKDRIQQLIGDHPDWSEEEVAWKLIEEMAVKGAGLLYPVYKRTQGEKGRLSIQTNPQFYRNADAIIKQASHFNTLAPNMQVKIPVTKAGILAIEEATYQGININATVCFTLPQAIAVAEAVERGLNRRDQKGKPTSTMHPVCTIMVGRLDDWIQVLAKRDGILVDPAVLFWPGVAVFKKAYSVFNKRDYRARLLAAAYRHQLHWSEFIGADVVLTIPYEWQVLFNASEVPIVPRIDVPVEPKILNALQARFPDFRRAYEPDGLAVEDFDTYGATVRTLRTFISSLHDLIALLRDFMLPNPDGY